MREKKNIELPAFEEVVAERKRLRNKMRYGRTLKSTAAVLVVAAAVAILVATLWLPVLQIYGNSMSPTLNDGQIIISVKSRHFSTGDVVAFYHGNKILVKRCIAGPSDWINIDKDGNIYVNDKKLDEPYVVNRLSARQILNCRIKSLTIGGSSSVTIGAFRSTPEARQSEVCRPIR